MKTHARESLAIQYPSDLTVNSPTRRRYELCELCAAGVHHGHSAIGCIAVVDREPRDWPCKCEVKGRTITARHAAKVTRKGGSRN